MTIGIGVLCRDGVVIASDGMCSNGPVGVENLKTHIIQNRILCCCAGADNYLQFFINFLNSNFNTFQFDCVDRMPDGIIFDIVNRFYTFITNLSVTNIPQQTQPILIQRLQNDFCSGNLQFQALIGFYHRNEFYLYRVDGLNISPIQPAGMWYTIIGSGFVHGMPSIHLIKKIIQIDSIPKVNNAINLAYWTVDHAIDVCSGGIGGNIAIGSIRKNDDNLFSIQMENIEQGKCFVEDVYRHIRTYFEQPEQPTPIPAFDAEGQGNGL